MNTQVRTEKAAHPRAQLRRALGLRGAVALGVGGTIGGGIFVLVGHIAALAGPAALLAFALAFVASLLIALPYAELACRYPQAGGGYAFAREVLGRGWGFLMGWVFWGAYIFVSGYVTLGFGGYFNTLTGLPPVWGAVGLILACIVVNVAGVKFSGQLQVLVIGLALAGLLGFAGAGMPSVDTGRFTPWMPNGFPGILSAALIAFLAFGGFDMVAAAGEEIERPERNLPLAILLTLAIVLVVYLLVAFAALGTLDWRTLGASAAPLADAAQAFLGQAGGRIVAVVAVLTTAATANAVLVVTSRISFAMARDGLLPAWLARVGPATGAPWAAVLASGGMLVLVALLGSLHISTAIGGFLYVVHFIAPLFALLKLRRRGGHPPVFQMPCPSVLLPLAFIMSLVLLVSSGTTGFAGGAAWLAIGLAVAWARHAGRHSAKQA
ncbi:APC family permease [Bordetella sp. BOR01]|uniref:APC family permease n=1 Tax=Bordetella sp. BOR01 TaxID=2854779 RepID=UPI001C45256D|nr:amino acid permease [Bordetella sp. BOR01]MBV7485126.1 amino acid permease [Bordetella sp. BOR01]